MTTPSRKQQRPISYRGVTNGHKKTVAKCNMDSNSNGISCAQFTFYNNFDSANLAKVEYMPHGETSSGRSSKPVMHECDAEFNIWTRPDCYGTPFENNNRAWFYFGLQAPSSGMIVRLNIVDLNKQAKMYSQGMSPVYRVLPGKPRWDRVHDKPVYSFNGDIFTLSFKCRTPENTNSIMYFAFTYPFTYLDLEKMLVGMDSRYLNLKPVSEDDIYYVRETVVRSIEGRNIDLITVSSYHGITSEREPQLKNMFLSNAERPFKFTGKKVIFVSARVHPGETPSSFVFNGLLNLLLTKDDPIAQALRRLYVFKMIPFLNPDGVVKGHYRTDTRGVNLNRVYLNPSLIEHPSVYAARALIRYYHFGFEKEDLFEKCDNCEEQLPEESNTDPDDPTTGVCVNKKVSDISLDEDCVSLKPWCFRWHNFCKICGGQLKCPSVEKDQVGQGDASSNESGIFMYLDLHGHASKKGVFMYGNHFDDAERKVECMLLPKLMSINNHNFHFNACNFTERNMYLKDKRDGTTRAGSGRVAVLTITGIIKSYTLECNYNTGRLVNVLPATAKEPNVKPHNVPVPPKYTPQIFEEVGRSLGASILDLTGQNPSSRLPNSEFHTLNGLRNWLHTLSTTPSLVGVDRPKGCRIRPSPCDEAQNRPSRMKTRATRAVVALTAQRVTAMAVKRHSKKPPTVPQDRKENLIAQPQTSGSSSRNLHKAMKVKMRKDYTLKMKNGEKVSVVKKGPAQLFHKVPKTKTDLSCKASKLPTTSGGSNDCVHLREIRFFKHSEGSKTVVAKYENSGFVDDSLVVSWDASTSCRPHIFTHKARVLSAPPLESKSNEPIPGSSKRASGPKMYSFTKGNSGGQIKSKLKKETLRRLASGTEILSKVDKKKKKIKKVK